MIPIVVASENGAKGARVAVQILRRGGSALDAVEQACRVVEDDPDEISVGYGGLPNALGEVELDASIMDGHSLEVGAVAALRGYGNAITLARAVMEQTPHVLLAGDGAAQLAQELGYPRASQRTDSTLARWRERFAQHGLPPGERDHLLAAVRRLTQPLDLQAENVRKATASAADKALDGQLPADQLDVFGTVNFLALDGEGNLASAVSTSGLGWKYPGRVGDSPIPGAGNYCDSRSGAAACTGMGEWSLRLGTARTLVMRLAMGQSLAEAGVATLCDLRVLAAPLPNQYIDVVALSPSGEHAGFSTVAGKQYLFQTGEMDAPTVVARQMVEVWASA